MGEIKAKRAREERLVGRVGREGVVGQSLERVGVSTAGRGRGEVESCVFGLRSCAVLCPDQSLVFGLSDLVLLEVKWSGGNGSGESDKRG